MLPNFPNMEKDGNLEIQGAQSKTNTKKTM